ncbi:DUF2946 domain-containing protein [Pectobacterium actinidiae]|uniref:DUF2946 domain-containing protein n=1 Tax=Pectobacterium actinidiae TaxID=1507808 RepID=A0ABW8G5S4_9GAMM|nr:hypothetical protein PEC301937_05490 [Pectobacterium carotovorum subsp. carotovorum]
MLLSALRRRSFPAWVGIFAILTIFIAPVISQTQVLHGAHAHENGTSTPDSTTTHRSTTAHTTSAHDTAASARESIAEPHHNHTGHAMSGHHATQSHHSSPSMMMDHAACGYCVLFSYTPALFATGSPTPILTASLSEVLVIHFISRIVLPERYVSPVVRAPPF